MSSKQSRQLTEASSPDGKRRKPAPLQYWCDSFDRSKHLLQVLKTWRESEHRIRHARGAVEKGEAIPADLKHIIDTMEKAMRPLPQSTELYFATYDPNWKYNPEWWLPCSRTRLGAEIQKRHHQPPSGPDAPVYIHKLVITDAYVPAVWAGDLGTEHDLEEEVVLDGDLLLKKDEDSGCYNVSVPDTPHPHDRVGHRYHDGSASEQHSEALEADVEEEEEEAAAAANGDDGHQKGDKKEEKPEEAPKPTSWSCLVS